MLCRYSPSASYSLSVSLLTFSLSLTLPMYVMKSVPKEKLSDLSKYVSNNVAKNVYFKGKVLEVGLDWKPHPWKSFISKIWTLLNSICLISLSNQRVRTKHAHTKNAWLVYLTNCQKIKERIKWYSSISLYGTLLVSKSYW